MSEKAGPDGKALHYPKRGAVNILTNEDQLGNDLEFPWAGDKPLQAGYVVTPPGGVVHVVLDNEPITKTLATGSFDITAGLTENISAEITLNAAIKSYDLTIWFRFDANGTAAKINKVLSFPLPYPAYPYSIVPYGKACDIVDEEAQAFFGVNLSAYRGALFSGRSLHLGAEIDVVVLSDVTVHYIITGREYD